jgi:hypothetical protein
MTVHKQPLGQLCSVLANVYHALMVRETTGCWFGIMLPPGSTCHCIVQLFVLMTLSSVNMDRAPTLWQALSDRLSW